MERLKDVFSGERLSFEEFCERLNTRPDIKGEYANASELERAKAQIDAEKAAREKDCADFAKTSLKFFITVDYDVFLVCFEV